MNASRIAYESARSSLEPILNKSTERYSLYVPFAFPPKNVLEITNAKIASFLQTYFRFLKTGKVLRI